MIHKPDPKNGDRFLLNLELGLDNTNQSFRLSEHVFQEKGNDTLCLPEGMNWNNNATVYFILPVKQQGKWVHYFINQLTDASSLTGDTNFHVIIVDFESKDIDMAKAFNTSLLKSRHSQRYPTEPLHKISALQVELELAGKFRNEIQRLLGRFSLEKICWDFIKYRLYLGKMNQNPFAG